MFIFTVSNSTVLFSMSAVKVHRSTTMKNQNKKENKKKNENTRFIKLHLLYGKGGNGRKNISQREELEKMRSRRLKVAIQRTKVAEKCTILFICHLWHFHLFSSTPFFWVHSHTHTHTQTHRQSRLNRTDIDDRSVEGQTGRWVNRSG